LLNCASSTAYASHSRRGPGYTNSKTSTCLESVTTTTIQHPLSKSVEVVIFYLNKLLVSLNCVSQSCTNMALGRSLLHVTRKLRWTVSMEWKWANKWIHRNVSERTLSNCVEHELHCNEEIQVRMCLIFRILHNEMHDYVSRNKSDIKFENSAVIFRW